MNRGLFSIVSEERECHKKLPTINGDLFDLLYLLNFKISLGICFRIILATLINKHLPRRLPQYNDKDNEYEIEAMKKRKTLADEM